MRSEFVAVGIVCATAFDWGHEFSLLSIIDPAVESHRSRGWFVVMTGPVHHFASLPRRCYFALVAEVTVAGASWWRV